MIGSGATHSPLMRLHDPKEQENAMYGDLFDILSNDERIIVYSSKEDSVIITWNQSDTLQGWEYKYHPGDASNDYHDYYTWEEVGILTQSGHGPKNYEQARKVAIAWNTGSL
jgi:hypothetical protein